MYSASGPTGTDCLAGRGPGHCARVMVSLLLIYWWSDTISTRQFSNITSWPGSSGRLPSPCSCSITRGKFHPSILEGWNGRVMEKLFGEKQTEVVANLRSSGGTGTGFPMAGGSLSALPSKGHTHGAVGARQTLLRRRSSLGLTRTRRIHWANPEVVWSSTLSQE